MDSNKVFLLNPAHADYLNGKRDTLMPPANMNPALKYFLWISIVLYLALTVGGLIWMGTALANWTALNQRGVTVTGNLTGRNTEQMTALDSPTSDNDRLYYWTYSYTTQDGQMLEGESQVTESAYNTYTANRAVEVVYLQNRPEVSYLLDGEAFSFPRVAVVAGGLNGLMMLFVGLLSWRGYAQDRRYRREGRIIEGRVTDPVLKTGESEGKPFATLYLNYAITSPETGEEIHKIEVQSRNDMTIDDLPSANDPVAVLYVSDRQFKLL
jgi:hypothetical protein